MVFKPTRIKRVQLGFSVIELLVGVVIGTIVLAGTVTFFLFGARSFGSMANYTDLNNKDRNASDVITRDIRSALQVNSATANQIVLQAPPAGGANTITYTYDSSAGTLTRIDTDSTRVLLTGLGSCTFSLYQRPSPTNVTYNSFPSATAAYAKLVSVQWSASRRLVGSQVNTESAQGALVYLRNR
jgi:Tfp pilus assembly protein PilW